MRADAGHFAFGFAHQAEAGARHFIGHTEALSLQHRARVAPIAQDNVDIVTANPASEKSAQLRLAEIIGK